MSVQNSTSSSLALDDASASPPKEHWITHADPSAVHRVCVLVQEECKKCPTFVRSWIEPHEENCVLGCYMRAVEIINVVETGNPWRKTVLNARAKRGGWVVLGDGGDKPSSADPSATD
jgi:hypothetical protein